MTIYYQKPDEQDSVWYAQIMTSKDKVVTVPEHQAKLRRRRV